MDLAQMFFSQAVTLFGYALLITAVYKMFQLSKEVQEIKELLKSDLLKNDLLKRTTRHSSHGAAPLPAISTVESDAAATEYAENLLRSLQDESVHSESEQQKTV